MSDAGGFRRVVVMLFAFGLGAHAFAPPTTWHDVLGFTAGAIVFVTLMTEARLIRWVASGLVILTLLAHFLLPVFSLPSPSGEFPVGTRDARLGEIPVALWYPASSRGARARYVGQETYAAIGDALGLPGWLFSHLGAIRGRASSDVEPAAGPFPVVVFSHGADFGYPRQNTMLAEQLASTGLVVVAIEHVGSSITTSTSARTKIGELRRAEPHLDAALERATTDAEIAAVARRALVERPRVSAFYRELLDQFVADQHAVIERLDELDLPIDHTAVSVGGMSFGGYAAMQTCVRDRRCRAGFNLDGAMPGIVEIEAIPVPFVVLASEANKLARLAPARIEVIENVTHAQFSDAARFSHLPLLLTLDDPSATIAATVGELVSAF